jgi:hypothetical protein
MIGRSDGVMHRVCAQKHPQAFLLDPGIVPGYPSQVRIK